MTVGENESTAGNVATGWVDRRFGVARAARTQLTKVFPDHWSFMLGEIVLYSFVILVLTGIYLTFFFEPSGREVTYSGSLPEFQGQPMTAAFHSALDLSFDVRFGLVARQMHHWSALIFMAAMIIHMLRVFFTGAFRRPREVNWIIGVLLLAISMMNGFLGYSLLDDLLSGTGLRVGYALLLGTPVIGPWLANIVFGGQFPDAMLIPRFFILHVLVLPGVIIGLVSAHLGLVWYQKHTQFPGPERTESNVVGTRLYPGYLLKMLGLFFFVVAITALLGGIAQINPVWKFGPFHGGEVAGAVTSAAQPDFYMGWSDGILRLIPGWETRLWGFSIPNYFWGVLMLPITFGAMMLWPFLEPLWTKDRRAHNLLQRPRDAPLRAAFGAGTFFFFSLLLVAASNDVLSTLFHVPPEDITKFLRVFVIVGPLLVAVVTWRVCRDLQGTTVHPVAPEPSHRVIRTPSGGFEVHHDTHDRRDHSGE